MSSAGEDWRAEQERELGVLIISHVESFQEMYAQEHASCRSAVALGG